jgi:microcystin-dependent protein
MPSSKFSTPTTLTTQSVLIDTSGVSDKRNLVYSLSSGKFIATVQAIPIGVVRMYVTGTAPSNYLICNGQAISRTTYAALYSVIGTKYGVGDNSTTFNLPNLIDYGFPYGSVANTSLPTTINIGGTTFDGSHTHNTTITRTVDAGANKAHNHSHAISGNESVAHTHNFGNTSANSGGHSHVGSSNSSSHQHNYQISNNSGSGNTGGISGNHTHNINNASASHNHNVNSASGHTHGSSSDGGTHSSHNYSITLANITLNHSHTLASVTGVYFYIRFQ